MLYRSAKPISKKYILLISETFLKEISCFCRLGTDLRVIYYFIDQRNLSVKICKNLGRFGKPIGKKFYLLTNQENRSVRSFILYRSEKLIDKN